MTLKKTFSVAFSYALNMNQENGKRSNSEEEEKRAAATVCLFGKLKGKEQEKYFSLAAP